MNIDQEIAALVGFTTVREENHPWTSTCALVGERAGRIESVPCWSKDCEKAHALLEEIAVRHGYILHIAYSPATTWFTNIEQDMDGFWIERKVAGPVSGKTVAEALALLARLILRRENSNEHSA